MSNIIIVTLLAAITLLIAVLFALLLLRFQVKTTKANVLDADADIGAHDPDQEDAEKEDK